MIIILFTPSEKKRQGHVTKGFKSPQAGSGQQNSFP